MTAADVWDDLAPGVLADQIAGDQKYCSLIGCSSPLHGHGLCSKHNWRRRKHGDPLVTRRDDPVYRFWAKITPGANECWQWTST